MIGKKDIDVVDKKIQSDPLFCVAATDVWIMPKSGIRGLQMYDGFLTEYGDYIFYHKTSDQDDLFKVAAYVLFHGKEKRFFIGSLSEFDDLLENYETEFFNKGNTIQVDMETIKAWFPKTINERIDLFLERACKTQRYLGEIIQPLKNLIGIICLCSLAPN